MNHPLWIPNISWKEKEVPGPWGNSPQFFCDFFASTWNVTKTKNSCKQYVRKIIYEWKTEKLALINSLLITLWYHNLCIHHNNGDIEKLGDEFGILSQRLEDDFFRHEFIQRIWERLIDPIPHENSKWIRKLLDMIEYGDIDIAELAFEISCFDLSIQEDSTLISRILGNKQRA